MYGVNGGVKVKCIDLLTDSQSAKSVAEKPMFHGG